MSKLTDFFKTTGTTQTVMSPRKRKLSLKRKPKLLKSSNNTADIAPKDRVVDSSSLVVVISDDEEDETSDSLCVNELNVSGLNNHNKTATEESSIVEEPIDSSASTIIYSPGTPRKRLPQPNSSSKSPVSALSSPVGYFSPAKQRYIKVKSPAKIKKNLFKPPNATENKDPVFSEACMGMDDKTIFLLTIINKYLNDDKLKPLLLTKSQELLTKCMHAKKPGARLVCRLFWRKERWNRLDQIKHISTEKKNDVDDQTIQDMINYLTENGVIESTNCQGSIYQFGLEDYLDVLKLNELKDICKEYKKKVKNMDQAKEFLRAYSRRNQNSNISSYFNGYKSDNASRVLRSLIAKTGPCYRLSEDMRQTLNELHLLMYLGIDDKILNESKIELTLINDKSMKECYPVDKDMPIDNASFVFRTRDEFEWYRRARNMYQDFLETTRLDEKCSIVKNVFELFKWMDQPTVTSYMSLPVWLHKFTPPYLYVKILEEGVTELKKLAKETSSDEHIELAVEILTFLINQNAFRQHKKGEWYAEKALIIDKSSSKAEEAALVLLEGFGSDLSDEVKDCMRSRAKLMAMRGCNPVTKASRLLLWEHAVSEIKEKEFMAKHIFKLPMDLDRNRGKIKFETRTADGLVVQDAEEFCISSYISEGKYTHGEHWEGRIVTTIFFLLFWDIIYSRVPGVFLCYYQMYPLDLFCGFYDNRKQLIDGRLQKIENSSIDVLLFDMSTVWEDRPETELSGIIRSIGWEKIRQVCTCLGPAAIAAICRRLATNYGYAYSGFPDLTLWNEDTKEIIFVEVKTDMDKPSLKQKQWMRYLKTHNIATEFCYVGSNTTRCRARNCE